MTKIEDFLKKFDATYQLDKMEPAILIKLYRQINDKRSGMAKDAKLLESKEKQIKDTIGQILKDRGITSSGKTDFGQAYLTTVTKIVTKDKIAFREWLKMNPEHNDCLLATPFKQESLQEMVGYDKDEELPDLPPGTEWFREKKVVIKK